MKNIVIGVFAHVDAGKTTLSESMLYLSGSIRKLGRVDHKDTFLDMYELERVRGITIFSKQANFTFQNTKVTLLDTPGHVDFSAEMERTLQVLDYAILIIGGMNGIQAHTKTVWRLLKKYGIPTILFVNKMDQPGADKEELMREIHHAFGDKCIDFTDIFKLRENVYEEIATCDESLLEEYLETGTITEEQIRYHICERNIFPCFFGSALRLEGVKELLEGIDSFTSAPIYQKEFGAKVYKIGRDLNGNRLTYLKVTGGTLKIKDKITDSEEKVNQIRLYSGAKFETVSYVDAGTICAVTGLSTTKPGEGLGCEPMSTDPLLIPVLNYNIIFEEGINAFLMLPKFQQLEEEIPELHIVWKEELQMIQAQIMGEVQIEIIKNIVEERFGIKIDFGAGKIVYRETIESTVEGIGHFEPLRHYAEVHLIMEPLERGSGLEFVTDCSEDVLDKNWQRLILTHLEEQSHIGVLTGSEITDMRITLVAGRAHQKHTEGGDFREATYRAVRQGLKKAKSILLEPFYEFKLELPDQMLGRAMMDLEKMNAKYELTQLENQITRITGRASVRLMQHYQMEVIAYTKGLGKLSLEFSGYDTCHNSEQVIQEIGYDSEHDLFHPTGSVFCAHGAGFFVPWNEVEQYMHIEGVLSQKKSVKNSQNAIRHSNRVEEFIDTEEIDDILNRTFYSNRKDKSTVVTRSRKRQWETSLAPVTRKYTSVKKEEYLLIDGYNVTFANDELKELAQNSLDAACNKLMDIVCDYQAMKGCKVLLVFDAYKVKGHNTEIIDYHNIQIVYTKEAETADQFIEKFSHQNAQKFRITVATSDGVEQIIIRSKGCLLLSARDFWEEIRRHKENLRDNYLDQQTAKKSYIKDILTEQIVEHVRQDDSID